MVENAVQCHSYHKGLPVPHSCWNSKLQSTQVVSRWRDPLLLNIVVLAVADGLFGLYGSEHRDKLFVGAWAIPNKLYVVSNSMDIKQHEKIKKLPTASLIMHLMVYSWLR